MASSGSGGVSRPTSAPPKVSLLQFPRYFFCFLAFLSSLYFCLKFQIFLHLSLQELRSNFVIPVNDKPGLAFLGPMGDVDPTEMINFETG
jgi:hypothetical protein